MGGIITRSFRACFFSRHHRTIGEQSIGHASADPSLRLAAIIESSDDAIVSKDLNGVITSWNHGAELVFGYTPEEAVGQSITMLIPPDRLSEEDLVLSKIRKGERVEHFETVRVRKDNRLIHVSVTVSPIRDCERQDRRRLKDREKNHRP
jgi:PAS domain S-box-containing protein